MSYMSSKVENVVVVVVVAALVVVVVVVVGRKMQSKVLSRVVDGG